MPLKVIDAVRKRVINSSELGTGEEYAMWSPEVNSQQGWSPDISRPWSPGVTSERLLRKRNGPLRFPENCSLLSTPYGAAPVGHLRRQNTSE